MSQRVRLWEVSQDSHLIEIKQTKLSQEQQIHSWLEEDISKLSSDPLVIGREVPTDYGGYLDLLCLDGKGNLVVVELKRDLTPRDVVAQIIDYASWVKELSPDRVGTISADYFRKKGRSEDLETAYRNKFGEDLPDNINESQRMYVVASELDGTTERAISYLSTFGVGINAATFQYFEKDGRAYLSRIFVIEPTQAEVRIRSAKSQRLTDEQLEELAEQNGVGEMYRTIVSGLMTPFARNNGTTKSSKTFGGTLGGMNKTILSILPAESNQTDGLKYRVYFKRFCDLFGFDAGTAKSLFPPNMKEWEYSRDPDYKGYQGFFGDMAAIKNFLEGLKNKQNDN